MFFDDINQIKIIAKNADFSIFVLDSPEKVIESFDSKNTYIVEEQDDKIRVDQIRELQSHLLTKSTADQFIIVKNAEHLNEEASNAFLKFLEEPKSNYHFVFFTNSTSSLLKTILSRAKIYFLRQKKNLEIPPNGKPEIIAAAKQLISASPAELVSIATNMSDKKLHKDPRKDAILTTSVAIEILYKSYFKTKNPKLLKRLDSLLALYNNLEKNGHVKLHLVAELC